MDISKTIREQISAFSDHELSPSTLPAEALRSAEGEHAWHAYHRIGDVIRDQGAPHLSDGFAGKLAARLAAEPVPANRSVRASSEALARRAPLVTPVALAAGAAGPVTGIGTVPGEAAGSAASGISETPLDPDGQALTEAPEEALDSVAAGAVVTVAAAAEASIAPGAEALSIAVLNAAHHGAAERAPGSDAGVAGPSPAETAAGLAAGTAAGMAGSAADKVADNAADGALAASAGGADDGKRDGGADATAGSRKDGTRKPSIGSLT